LYTELAKSYFLLGPFMAEENTLVCPRCGVGSSELGAALDPGDWIHFWCYACEFEWSENDDF
jgi:hypothetical protein